MPTNGTIHIVYGQGTLLRPRRALVKSKEMAIALTFDAVEEQSRALLDYARC